MQDNIVPFPSRKPPETEQRYKSSLPTQLTSFIGREQEVAQACALLRRPDVRLLTFIGPGGVGKTRLALQVATDLLDDFADGVSFVPLAPVSHPDFVLPTIAQTFRLKETGNQPLSDLLKEYLRNLHLLLFLDNFEQVEAAAPLLAELLVSCPELKILECALTRSGEESASLRVRVLQATANIVYRHGDFDRAEALVQQSLALCRELGDTRGIANSLSLLAEVANMRGNTAEAFALPEEHVRLMQQIGEPGEVARALFFLADEVSMRGEYGRGQTLFEEALLLFRKAGNELLVGGTLVWSAFYLWWSASSDVATVRQRLQQGRTLISRVGDRNWIAHSSLVAALMALSEGKTARAYDLAQESLAIYREMDSRRYIAVMLNISGWVEAQRSDLREARNRFLESLALAQELGEKWIIPFDLEGLAGVLATQGEVRWAAQLWGAAEVLREGTAL